MSTLAEHQATNTPLVEQYATYPFDTDEIYQQGLANILANGAGSTREEQEEMLRRTRVFYFNKVTGASVTLDEAKAYERSRQEQMPSSQSSGPVAAQQESTTTSGVPQNEEEPHVLTLAKLKELIETGHLNQIPNNKVIPDTLNEAPPSQSTAPVRRKPWEAVAQGTSVPATHTAVDIQEKSN